MAACPLTIHALLHIAPTIRAMGPVWMYWAFPMECYCSDIACKVRTQWFPYAKINEYVTSHAQLAQITLLYDLHDELQLAPPVSHDKDVKLPLCKSFVIIMNTYFINTVNQIHYTFFPTLQDLWWTVSLFPCGRHSLPP